MNRNLALRTIRDRWRSTVVYAGALAVYALMISAIYPTFKKMTGFQDLFKEYPESLTRIFGMETINLNSFNSFVVMEYLALIWVIIVAAFVIAFARYMIAGEMEQGTMELLLTQPIERWKVLATKWAVFLCAILSIVLVTVTTIIVFGTVFKVGVSYSGLLSFIPVGFALSFAIAGYSVMFSTIFHDTRKVALAAAGLTLVFYLIHFAAGYWGFFKVLDHVSIFHYYDPLSILEKGTVDAVAFVSLLGFGIVFSAVSFLVFRTRDITV